MEFIVILPLFGGKKVNDSYNNNDFKSDID